MARSEKLPGARQLQEMAARWRTKECPRPHCVDYGWAGSLLETLRLDATFVAEPLGSPARQLWDDSTDKYSDSIQAVLTRWSEQSCDTACIYHDWVRQLLRFFFDDAVGLEA